MKMLILICLMLISGKNMANDMSKAEDSRSAYRTLSNGTSQYFGKCSTHEIYKNSKYFVTKTLIPYFQSNYDSSEFEILKTISVLEPSLVNELKKHLEIQSFKDMDDFIAQKIESVIVSNLELYQLSIGVGGGNGLVLVFNRIVTNHGPVYELISKTLDGDVEFCDSKVWAK